MKEKITVVSRRAFALILVLSMMLGSISVMAASSVKEVKNGEQYPLTDKMLEQLGQMTDDERQSIVDMFEAFSLMENSEATYDLIGGMLYRLAGGTQTGSQVDLDLLMISQETIKFFEWMETIVSQMTDKQLKSFVKFHDNPSNKFVEELVSPNQEIIEEGLEYIFGTDEAAEAELIMAMQSLRSFSKMMIFSNNSGSSVGIFASDSDGVDDIRISDYVRVFTVPSRILFNYAFGFDVKNDNDLFHALQVFVDGYNNLTKSDRIILGGAMISAELIGPDNGTGIYRMERYQAEYSVLYNELVAKNENGAITVEDGPSIDLAMYMNRILDLSQSDIGQVLPKYDAEYKVLEAIRANYQDKIDDEFDALIKLLVDELYDIGKEDNQNVYFRRKMVDAVEEIAKLEDKNDFYTMYNEIFEEHLTVAQQDRVVRYGLSTDLLNTLIILSESDELATLTRDANGDPVDVDTIYANGGIPTLLDLLYVGQDVAVAYDNGVIKASFKVGVTKMIKSRRDEIQEELFDTLGHGEQAIARVKASVLRASQGFAALNAYTSVVGSEGYMFFVINDNLLVNEKVVHNNIDIVNKFMHLNIQGTDKIDDLVTVFMTYYNAANDNDQATILRLLRNQKLLKE